MRCVAKEFLIPIKFVCDMFELLKNTNKKSQTFFFKNHGSIISNEPLHKFRETMNRPRYFTLLINFVASHLCAKLSFYGNS